MTTPTNEEVRRQFEAAMRDLWGDSFHAERHPKAPDEYLKAPEQMAWLGYQAALSSPAVVALVEALKAVAPYVVSGVLEHCNGNKCREQWCAGCMGEEDAEASVEEARKASFKLYAALAGIAPFTTGAGHE